MRTLYSSTELPMMPCAPLDPCTEPSHDALRTSGSLHFAFPWCPAHPNPSTEPSHKAPHITLSLHLHPLGLCGSLLIEPPLLYCDFLGGFITTFASAHGWLNVLGFVCVGESWARKETRELLGTLKDSLLLDEMTMIGTQEGERGEQGDTDMYFSFIQATCSSANPWALSFSVPCSLAPQSPEEPFTSDCRALRALASSVAP